MIIRIIASFTAAICLATSCWAALAPEEIVIVAARGSRESEGLARYYARVRGVPTKNLCLVDLPESEVLPREAWEAGVRPGIRKWLTENDPEQKTRCLLTVWGVPLKIGPADTDEQSRRYRQFLEDERRHRLQLLVSVRENLDKLASEGIVSDGETNGGQHGSVVAKSAVPAGSVDSVADGSLTAPDVNASEGSDAKADDSQPPADGNSSEPSRSELQEQRVRLEKALQSAQVRLAKLAAGDMRSRAQLQLQQVAAAVGGASVILRGLNQQIAANPEALPPAAKSEFDLLRGRASAFTEVRLLLDHMAPSIERDSLVLAVLERIGGLLVTIEWLDEQIKIVDQNETGASFDSELALVMWPDDYQLLRWQPNYLRVAYDNSQLRKTYRTLMVARLDAPTLQLAKGLVDTAMKVENESQGLRGKVYIDGRGIAKLEDTNIIPGSYAEYDKALLITAKGIDEHTDMDVVLDTSPQLFQQGSCPDAALYCGWYSLAKYVDAFDWKPGSVAYHLASSEAHTLRDPGSKAWCKALIEDGVCATIGPVYEPYLVSFPRPNDFFALLLRGELTLVECYARSNPYNSWMMTLIGDPLYRPFKNHPFLAQAIAEPASATGQPPVPPTTQ